MIMLTSRLSARLLAAILAPCAAFGQLQSPDAFLGRELGSAFTPHHRVVAYFEHVADIAQNVEIVQYGHTYEGRPLLYAVVSSRANMAALESIRLANLQRAQLAAGTPDAAGPSLVWLSYNVHGNEAVSTEAAMQTLFDLADSSNARTQGWLSNTVVFLDPCLNPDGRERYVGFYNRTAGRVPNPRPEAREHHEPWPGGRTNHYYFDLNRDWAWGTQLETRQRLEHFRRWMPHIHVDFHEQSVDSPYYFAPAAEPYHEAITPWQRELQYIIGRNHARYFDEEGWLYFTRQVFDLFYPGYGDTWPMFNGAIGMTYEQGGSGRAGLQIITAEADTLTLEDRIRHHHATGLSTIEVASVQRERILREFAAYFAESGKSGRFGAYVLKPRSGDALAALARHLDMQGIAYGRVTQTHAANGYAYASGEETNFMLAPGDMVVSASQPLGVLTRVLFEPESMLSDSLSYDITGWSLPYVYGLEAYAVAEEPPGISLGWQRRPPDIPESDRPAAYVAEWASFEDARLLASMLAAGVRVRFAEIPFAVAGRSYGRGTLIITRGSNAAVGDNFDRIVRQAAAELGQPLFAVESTMVTEGVDFGSADVPHIRRPRVGMVADGAASSGSLGELWHYFDRQLVYPVTLIHSDDFGSVHLYNYDVLILPGGSYSDLLTEGILADVSDWIRAGGKLIALEGAARHLAGRHGFSLKQRKRPEDTTATVRTYAARAREAISKDIPGAIFRVSLDATHPLAFGYGQDYFTLRRDEQAFEYLKDGWNVGVLREDSRLSGFAGARAVRPLENSLLFGVEELGRGEVVYLLDNPIYRGFWYSGRLMLANAVFLVGQRTQADF